MGLKSELRLLLFSDLHCDVVAAKNLVARSQEADIVICAGDLATTRRRLNLCLDVLKAITKPTVLVPGNNESLDELAAACRDWPNTYVLHGEHATINGVELFGLGGGIPVTPFGDWSFDFTEEQAAELLENCPPGGVLVSHSPPRGAVDVASNGVSLGSTAIRSAVERLKPKLVVCGHIHGSAGQSARIGPTTVINAGPDGLVWPL